MTHFMLQLLGCFWTIIYEHIHRQNSSQIHVISLKSLNFHLQICSSQVIVSLSVRTTNFTAVHLEHLRYHCKAMYETARINLRKITPSMWTMCHAIPFHAEVSNQSQLLSNYKLQGHQGAQGSPQGFHRLGALHVQNLVFLMGKIKQKNKEFYIYWHVCKFA